MHTPACDTKRPCGRCQTLGHEEDCHDPDPRKRGRKPRGPRVAGPSSTSVTSSTSPTLVPHPMPGPASAIKKRRTSLPSRPGTCLSPKLLLWHNMAKLMRYMLSSTLKWWARMGRHEERERGRGYPHGGCGNNQRCAYKPIQPSSTNNSPAALCLPIAALCSFATHLAQFQGAPAPNDTSFVTGAWPQRCRLA